MRPTVIAGNWKMYKKIDDAKQFIKELIPLIEQAPAQVYLAVPFTAIAVAAEAAAGSKVVIGAQNMNDASEGAFTGEVAAKMLLDAGARFVLLGHSDRRQLFKEDSAFVNRKVLRALHEKIQPIVCIGETIHEREQGQTEAVLKSQILESLYGVTAHDLEKIILAYEPVWAIGTNRTATPKIAQETHHFCRSVLAEQWGQEYADKVVIQYGGSVKPINAPLLLAQPDIDGLLVGGSSLEVVCFSEIVNSSIPKQASSDLEKFKEII